MACKCDRCGYNTNSIYDFKKHLLKKRPCPNNNMDISMADMFTKYFPLEGRSNFLPKNIEHYRELVEAMTGGRRNRLDSGVTNVSTNEFHAEVKPWRSFAKALGRLLAFDVDDNKRELRVYFFGEYAESDKQIVLQVFTRYNIRCFEFVDEFTCREIIDV